MIGKLCSDRVGSVYHEVFDFNKPSDLHVFTPFRCLLLSNKHQSRSARHWHTHSRASKEKPSDMSRGVPIIPPYDMLISV